ncbi:MAG: ABC-F family ATP-binding cassette domain-containing protein, partial [Clostridiales bacterium]|nr:ABC-F family ATP-binding cassette domain-containing protein [Clostridiales bacterium]
DRDLLDTVCTHILALEKQGARVVAGNYSTYRKNKRNQDELEREQNERIKADIKRLRQSAREKADWSDRVEATKIGQGACDRGFIGHKAAKAMKRSKAIETRITRQIKEQESLLQNMEQTASLKLQPLPPMGPVVMRFDKVNFGYGDKPFIQQMDLVLKPGDRLAVTGNNGSGKTTLLKLMKGDIAPSSGNIWQPRGLITSYLPQTSAHLSGTPRELVLQTGLDLTLFFALLRKFDFARELFDRDIRGFSLGQRKKVLLATTLAQPAHLYLWDEPLNDIDPESREQIEDMLSDTGATMVFIEHERAFLDKIKTREITLSPASCG